MSYECLSIKQTEVIQIITLNRPDKLNALNETLLQELFDCLKASQTDSSIQGLILTGAGEKAFCAGADIKQLALTNAQTGYAFAKQGQAVFSFLENLGKPSLAAINGYAFGGGCELAMAATLRVASEQAVFGQPEIKLGVIPGYGGTQRLPRLIGKGRALAICLSGNTFSAKEALDWGFLTEIYPANTLLDDALGLMKILTQQAPIAASYIMNAINKGMDLPLADALELEATLFGLSCATKDKTIGTQAFIEKRPPVFEGC